MPLQAEKLDLGADELDGPSVSYADNIDITHHVVIHGLQHTFCRTDCQYVSPIWAFLSDFQDIPEESSFFLHCVAHLSRFLLDPIFCFPALLPWSSELVLSSQILELNVIIRPNKIYNTVAIFFGLICRG